MIEYVYIKDKEKNMKVIDNSKSRTFDELVVGDVFTVNNGVGYYMRIANHTNPYDYPINAINLEYGTTSHFSDGIIVKKIDATLVIGTVPVVENQVNTKEESETKEENETEKLKKMTLAEIAEHCYNRKNKSCVDCPIYSECDDYDVPKTFENLYTILNK